MTIFMQTKVDMHKSAPHKRASMKAKTVLTLMNRDQLAKEINFPKRKLYRAQIEPDAVDLKGAPLYFYSRITEIEQLLKHPKFV